MSRAREIADLVGGATPDIILKTSDGAILNLQTSDTTVTANSVLGEINFQAPDEASGTDAILVASKIEAVAEGTFSASSNATSLVFTTANSAAAGTASGKMTFTSGGELILKDTDTADGSSPTITLQSGDTDIAVGDVLGTINFQAPDEGAGTDAILVAAGISAISEGDFSSSNNATRLVFKTGASAVADSKFEIASDGSLSTPTLGTSNVRFGVNAGNSIASGGNFNTVVGDEAGTAISTGDLHTFIGYGAGDAVTTEATGLTAVGANALTSNTSGTDNVAIGTSALEDCTQGIGNVAVGRFAAADIIDADGNVAIGGFDGTVQPAMRLNTKSHDNVAIGAGALAAHNLTNNSSGYNTAVGYSAGLAVTTGVQNTLIGGLAGDAFNVGEKNVALGYVALSTDTKGNKSTAIGYAALNAQNFTTATDSFNTAVGFEAGGAVTTGTHNTFVGGLSGDGTDDGARNTAVGYLSLTSNCGNKNTAVGALAGQGVTGINNTIVGEEAGILCTGNNNTFIGAYNSSSGGCGEAMTTGDNNTILGAFNGNQNSVDIRTEDNQVVISDGDGKVKQHMDFHNRNVMYATHTTGYSIHVVNSAASGLPEGIRVQYTGTVPNTQNGHFLQLGDSSSARCVIDTNGNLRNINNSYGGFSDLKLKENIADASSQWDDIKAVKVKKYSMKTDESETANRIGVIAQDLEESGMNGLVTIVTDKDADTREDLGTETRSVKYSVLYMKAIKALQEAMTRIETLESENTAIKNRLDALEAE